MFARYPLGTGYLLASCTPDIRETAAPPFIARFSPPIPSSKPANRSASCNEFHRCFDRKMDGGLARTILPSEVAAGTTQPQRQRQMENL